MSLDHPIFLESIQFIRSKLGKTQFDQLEQSVLERLIHSSGDFSVQSLLRFSPEACEKGISALKAGAPILTDTFMAAAAIRPMAARTLKSKVYCGLEWTEISDSNSFTRTSIGIERAFKELLTEFSHNKAPLVVIGSSPTALEALLELVSKGLQSPSLMIGMPVGFIRVVESKKFLENSECSHIRLEGTKGGASLAAACVNALLRAAV